MSILSGDIRDQSRKWSEIAPNFGRFFRPHKFQRVGLPKVIPILSPLPRGTSPGKMFCEDTSTSAEVIGAQTLNFKPNFKFSRINFFRGSPLAVVVCASKCWPICKSCKNLRGSTPQGWRYSLPKNVRLGGSILAPITLLFVDQVHPIFVIQRGRGCS